MVNLLNVQEGPGMSYSWHSIVRGVKAMNEGLIWRVGDGTNINIWLDPWIPDGVTRRPITPRGQTLLTKISELIDPITGTWDHVLIEEVFWEEDWKCILSIPIKQGMDDLIAWHFDRKGVFSVKSAYHTLDAIKGREACRQVGASSSSAESSGASPSNTDFCWKKIWSKCPPKVQQFFWRFTHKVTIALLCGEVFVGVGWRLILGVQYAGGWMRMVAIASSNASFPRGAGVL